MFLRIVSTTTLGIFLGVSLSSCRLGNSTPTPTPTPSSNSDHTSGYYLAAPSSIKLYVTTTETVNQKVSTDLIPGEVQQYISNPVALVMNNPADTGGALFVSAKAIADGGKLVGLPINVGADNSLQFKGSTTPETYWTDSQCQMWSDWILSGQLTRDSTLSPPAGIKVSISGSIDLTLQLIYRFKGDCKATFTTVMNCYSNPAQCGGSSQSQNLQLQLYVTQTFDPFIQAGLIRLEDLPNLTNFAYEVSYRKSL